MLFLLVDVCENPYILRIIYFIKNLMDIIFFIIPIGLILIISFDFVMAVIAKKVDDMNKKTAIVIKRIIMCICLFLLPTIVDFSMNLLGDLGVRSKWLSCINNAELDKISDFQIQYALEKYKHEYNAPTLNLDPTTGSVVSPNQGGLGEYSQVEGDFLKVAEELWITVYKGNFVYEGKTNKPIPISGTTIDCSSYVSWVLYKYGYEDFKGAQKTTLTFLNTDWKSKYGWEEIKVSAGEDVTNKLKPGDILVRDSGQGGTYGHVNIIVKVENGDVYAFDCGGTRNWKDSKGKPIKKNSFAKTSNYPGKIIRVTKPN